MVLTASYKTFTDSGATAHMMKDLSVISGKAVSFEISTGTADRNTIKATAQIESVIKLPGLEKPVALNRNIFMEMEPTSAWLPSSLLTLRRTSLYSVYTN